MLESIYNYLSSSNPYLIYTALLLIPFIENIFPPAPSDVMIVVGGTLITQHIIGFIPALFLTSLGSEIGFLLLFYLGTQTDKKIIRSGRLSFINQDALATAESWFNKYGFALILFNRFISGIRSVIAYFAGVSELDIKRTVVLSSASSVLWHLMLLLLGMFFGKHVEVIDHYLSVYGTVITLIFCAVIIYVAIRYYAGKKKNTSNPQ